MIMAALWFLRDHVFPIPELQAADTYTSRHLEMPQLGDATDELEQAARLAKNGQRKQLLTHAQKCLSDEQHRESSIISRAQGLIVAQTFFGALLAFGTAVMGRTDQFSGWSLPVLWALILYTLIQVLLLTCNALRATAGLKYRRIGRSELIRWLPMTESAWEKNMALATLQDYRQAHVVNTWRSIHLHYAQACLRNIVFALAALVTFIFLTIASLDQLWSHI